MSNHRSRLLRPALVALALVAMAACSQNAPHVEQGQTVDDSAPVADSVAVVSTTSVPVAPAEVPMYTVEKGDTIGRIATKMGVDKQLVIDANGLLTPDKIKIGQKLRVPAGGKVPSTGTPVGDPRSPTTTVAP